MTTHVSALHARGGGPGNQNSGPPRYLCSPRTWRWSVAPRRSVLGTGVLSTHVEVVRLDRFPRIACSGALHARGGGPPLSIGSRRGLACSPRTWRWSVQAPVAEPVAVVLSTHVEVVRLGSPRGPLATRALHARGGGPVYNAAAHLSSRCSPRTWRWSVSDVFTPHSELVLSTHVEVVRAGVEGVGVEVGALHARGGGPLFGIPAASRTSCSPRTWRWSAGHDDVALAWLVLSTHVEVVRRKDNHHAARQRALHARGGGPPAAWGMGGQVPCSPRTWRWSA